eukprot:403370501
MTTDLRDNFFCTLTGIQNDPNNLKILPKNYRGSENYVNQKNEFNYLRDYDNRIKYQEMDQYWSASLKQTYDGIINEARKSNRLKRFPLLKQFDDQLKNQEEQEQQLQQNWEVENAYQLVQTKKKLSPRLKLMEEMKQFGPDKSIRVSARSPTCSTKIKNREILRDVQPPEIFHSVVLNSSRAPQNRNRDISQVDMERISQKIRNQGRYRQLSAIGNETTSNETPINPLDSARVTNTKWNQRNQSFIDTQRISQQKGHNISQSPDILGSSHVNSTTMNSTRKAFLRSSPRPVETVITDQKRLINNHNDFKSFLTRENELYKVKVFENFKNMKSQMNKAFLRQRENKKFFKGNNAVPEDQIKIKEEDDATIGKISNIFKYVHKHQRTMSSGVQVVPGNSQRSGRMSSFANRTMNNSDIMNMTQYQLIQ